MNNSKSTLQDLKSKVQQYMEHIKVDSYTAILRIGSNQKITTNNLCKVALEDHHTFTGAFQVFYNKKKYNFSVTNSDALKEQIYDIPLATASMEEAEYYEFESIPHAPMENIASHFTLSTHELLQVAESLLNTIKNINLVDDTILITSSISDSLIFNKANYAQYNHTSSSSLYMELLDNKGEKKYEGSFYGKVYAHMNYQSHVKEILDEIEKSKQEINLPTGTYKIIFHNKVSSELLDMIVNALMGDNLWQKQSFLADKLNEKVFGSAINIMENPHMPNSLYNSSVDMEGTPTSEKYLVKNGVVTSLLLNREYAHKFKTLSTGNGWNFDIGYTNIFLQPGTSSLDDMLKEMHTGIVVMQTLGPGFHVHNGEISISIKGFYVENGSFKGAVNGTLNGNIVHILQKVNIGNDINYDFSLACSSIEVSPMTFASVSD